MSEEQCNNVVEVNWDFWKNNDYMRILNSGVPLHVKDSSNNHCLPGSVNWISARYCAKPEVYDHPSIVSLLKSAPGLQKDTACHALGVACMEGDVERVRELLTEGLADINNDHFGRTPLMLAVKNNKTFVVALLLTYKDLVLDKPSVEGYTALHYACGYGMGGTSSLHVVQLLGSDKRCTPVVLNKRDNYGDSPLMWAVMLGNLQSVKEMDKLQGVNFRTVNKLGEGLLDVVLNRIGKKSRKGEYMSVHDYLLNRRKVESLKVLAAHAVACLLSCETDVEKLDVPLILHPWVAGFLQTSPIGDSWSDFSDEEEDGWNTSSSNDEDEN